MPKTCMDFRQSGKLPGNPRGLKYEDFLWKCPNEGPEARESVQGGIALYLLFTHNLPLNYRHGYCYIRIP